MTRDPSDGTVRETKPIAGLSPVIKPAIDPGTSGLQTDKLKAEDLARLEKSRDWLRRRFNSRAEQTDSGLPSTKQGEI